MALFEITIENAREDWLWRRERHEDYHDAVEAGLTWARERTYEGDRSRLLRVQAIVEFSGMSYYGTRQEADNA